MSSPSSPVVVNSRPGSSGSESSGSSHSQPDELGWALLTEDQEDFIKSIVNHATKRLYDQLGDDATYPHWTWKFGVQLRHSASPGLIQLEDGKLAGTGCVSYKWVAVRVPMDEDVDDGKNPRDENGEPAIPIPIVDNSVDDNDSGHSDNGIVENNVSDEGNSLPSTVLDDLDDENDEVSPPSVITDDRVSPSGPSSSINKSDNGVSLRNVSSRTDTDNNGISLPHLTLRTDADANGLSCSYADSGNICNGVSILSLDNGNGGHVDSSDAEKNYADDEDDSGPSPRFKHPPPILTNFNLMSTVALPLTSSHSGLFVIGSPSSSSGLSSTSSRFE